MSLKLKFWLIAATLSTQMLSIAAAATNWPSGFTDDVAVVTEVLESCPAWSDPKTDKDAILNHLNRLSELSTPIIRAGAEKFVAHCRSKNNYDVGNMSKLFVLNRFIFAVPEKEAYRAPFFGGWEGVPHDEQWMNPMWPLALAKDGKLVLTGRYSGYSGHPYLAVQEFDFFLQKYARRGPRALVSPTKPNGVSQ